MKQLVLHSFKLFLAGGLLLFSIGSLQARQVTLKVAFSHMPPFAFKNESGTNDGLIFHIVQEVFSRMKGPEGKNITYGLEVVYSPNKRIDALLKTGQVDAATFVLSDENGTVYPSDSLLSFHNQIISYNGLPLPSLEALKGKKVVAFQNAHKLLGASFKKAIKGSKHYREVREQALQLKLLHGGRTDYIVLERNIFEYHRKKHNIDFDRSKLAFFSLGKVKRWISFQDKNLRDRFNEALASFKTSQDYAQLVPSYEDS